MDVLERVLDLTGVSVREEPVRGDVVVDLGEELLGDGLAAAAEVPDIASTTIPVGSTMPPASSGASASADAVG